MAAVKRLAMSAAVSLVAHLGILAGLSMLAADSPGRSVIGNAGAKLVVALPAQYKQLPFIEPRTAAIESGLAGVDSSPQASAGNQPSGHKQASDGHGTQSGLPLFDPYRSIADLDEPPEPFFVPPLDSAAMRGSRQYERVELKLLINDSGGIDQIEIVSGNEPFAEQAKAAFLGARFAPGRLNGQAVPSKVYFEIEYPALQ